jgi:hypothetical protein
MFFQKKSSAKLEKPLIRQFPADVLPPKPSTFFQIHSSSKIAEKENKF